MLKYLVKKQCFIDFSYVKYNLREDLYCDLIDYKKSLEEKIRLENLLIPIEENKNKIKV